MRKMTNSVRPNRIVGRLTLLPGLYRPKMTIELTKKGQAGLRKLETIDCLDELSAVASRDIPLGPSLLPKEEAK